MPSPVIVVAVPTLRGGPLLEACIASLLEQTEAAIEISIVDNSGCGMAAAQLAKLASTNHRLRVHTSPCNLGFAAAVNLAWRRSSAPYCATINDDAEAHPHWAAELRAALDAAPQLGMCASQVMLHGTDRLDSAGMRMGLDGSSKQRGQNQPATRFAQSVEVLCPSASAAIYRRSMLDRIGMFDEAFFAYCEDTDLGLRARRAGWNCIYVPTAKAFHHYSQTAGHASPLKALLIERNRIRVAFQNFPAKLLLRIPAYATERYFWHAAHMVHRRGMAARYAATSSPLSLALVPFRGHLAVLRAMPDILRKRARNRGLARISDREFVALLRRHSISPREIAAL